MDYETVFTTKWSQSFLLFLKNLLLEMCHKPVLQYFEIVSEKGLGIILCGPSNQDLSKLISSMGNHRSRDLLSVCSLHLSRQVVKVLAL